MKRFDPKWVADLGSRGEAKVYTKANSGNFDYLGMPVGGIGQGMMYLAGDGKLWRWDIFNAEIPDSEFWYEPGAEYEHPLKQDEAIRHPLNGLQQGFAVQVGENPPRCLDRSGFKDISFRGAYPVGEVRYRDDGCPVEVHLTAFSPFIPLDVNHSSYPATVLRYTFNNTGTAPVDCRFAGWMENGNAWKTRHISGGTLVNKIEALDDKPTLQLGALPDVAISRNADIGNQAIGFYSDSTLKIYGKPKITKIPADCFIETETGGLCKTSFTEAARNQSPVGCLTAGFSLKPGEARTITCILAWYNPFSTTLLIQSNKRRSNSNRYKSAADVVKSIGSELDSLTRQTLLWRDTWNDSTLPTWFLDRTFANTSTLATSTFYALADGRFYGYEGCYSCPGTCTHVYQYAQAAARLFPELERSIRTKVDLRLAFDSKTGQIGTRGENFDTKAVDGQAGTILRFYREHLTSPNDQFLRENWNSIKLSFQPLFAHDPDRTGLLSGAQWNTLDAAWYGNIAWISGLYVAALRAGEAMARICEDEAFAAECKARADAGANALATELFRNGYFINRVDPTKPESTNSGLGCHIDQLLGQSWAFQVGLPRVFTHEQSLSALNALWRNNFTTDVGPYRAQMKGGRNYAMPGEGGMLMCTFPDKDWNFAQASGSGKGAYPGYFNECMSGFEYQVASHMIWEGLTMQGLALVRTIDDRYDGAKRNPWNEVECGSHYARAMASYGAFLAVCGFEYDGPQGRIGFAPRLTPNDFRCAFTAAEGWGTYSQKRENGTFKARIEVKWGKLKLNSVGLTPDFSKTPQLTASLDGSELQTSLVQEGTHLTIQLTKPLELAAGQSLTITLADKR